MKNSISKITSIDDVAIARDIAATNVSLAYNATDDVFKYLVQCCPNLMKLSLALRLPGSENITDFTRLGQLHSLQELDFTGTKIDNAGLTALVPRCDGHGNLISGCPNLTKLNLTWCWEITDFSPLSKLHYLQDLNIAETTINNIQCAALCNALAPRYDNENNPISGCPNLTELNLSGCNNITDFTPIGQLHQLSKLNLGVFKEDGESNITDAGFSSLCSALEPRYDTAGNLISGCPNLTQLNLNVCCEVTDFMPIAQLKSLQNLSLGAAQIDNDGLAALAQGCQNLTTLNLGCCENITDFSPIGQLQSLENLDLWGTNINDDGLEALAQGCPRLTKLTLELCKQITNFASLGKLEKLQMLNLSKININNTALDTLCNALAQGCPRLTTLNLSYCSYTTDFRPIGQLHNLKELNLSGTCINNAALNDIVQGCPDLSTVTIWEGKDITDFSPLGQLKKLQKLDLAGTKIDDMSLASFTQGCPNLTTLNLRYCTNITDFRPISQLRNVQELDLEKTSINDVGLFALVQHCSSLTNLNLMFCNNIKDFSSIGQLYNLENLSLGIGLNEAKFTTLRAQLPNCEIR